MWPARLWPVLLLPLLLWIVGGCTPCVDCGAQEAGRSVAESTHLPLPRPRLQQLSLVFIGDIMAHRPNFQMDNYDAIYAFVRDDLEAADLTFANLEAPVDAERAYHTWPRFNVQPPYLRAAVDGGVDVFSLANNHSSDWGVAGVKATRSALLELRTRRRRARGLPIGSYIDGNRASGGEQTIEFAGLRGQPGDELQVVTIRRLGWRIGLIAVTQFQNVPSGGGRLVQVVDYRQPAQAEALLRYIAARAPHYDLLVVSYHAGLEYRIQPDDKKADYFRQLVEAGADVVWGHHPHVLQPWELVERKDGRRALVMYSTGNFVSGQTWLLGPSDADRQRAFTGDSALFRLSVRHSAAGADVMRMRPLFISNLRLSNMRVADAGLAGAEGLAGTQRVAGAGRRGTPDGVVVRPLQALARTAEISPEWRAYYRYRLRVMLEQFAGQPCGRCMEVGNPNLVR